MIDMADGDAVVSDKRVRHVYPTSDPSHRFTAGGLINSRGVITDSAALHRMMVQLAQCIENASRAQPADNPGLPSGYTYFLQFIAHDMTDSVSSLVMEDDEMRPGAVNARQRPLMLDTLYGAGPESDGHAFAACPEVLVPNSNSLRTHLRVGAVQPPKVGSRTTFCPYRDLARAKPPADDGLGDNGRWFTEVYLADRRNDSHAFLSQLTVLLKLLHNAVLRRLETLPDGPMPLQEAHRRFLCARTLVTLVYREIIANDVLPKILDPAVLQRYRNFGTALFSEDPSMPSVEFTHGAFRFAHSIVRDRYDIRGEGQQDTFIGLSFNSSSSPKNIQVPSTQIWFVDWARFFQTSQTVGAPNLSKAIGPHYGIALRDGGLFPKKTDIDLEGLAIRDLLSAAFGGLLSAPALSAKFQTMFSGLVRNYDEWKAPLRTWLTAHWPGGVAPPAADLDRLVNDPPLAFFVMFEAEQAAQGKTLGPIGSIIVAETMFGVLTTQLTGFEAAGATLRERAEACAAAMFPDRAAAARTLAAEVGAITSMPALLDHLAGVGELKVVA